MVVIGKTTNEKQRVVDVSYESLMKALDVCKPGAYVADIGGCH